MLYQETYIHFLTVLTSVCQSQELITLDVCTSCISRCDQVAMLLINPSMRKESMLILIMLLHAVDHRVDIGVDAFL